MVTKIKHIEIISERFVIKTLTDADATPRYLSWLGGNATRQYISYAEHERTLEDLRSYIADKSDREDVLFFGIFLKDELLHIGNIKYEPVDTEKRYAIMGIMIGEQEWQGKGVGPEVIKTSAMWLRQEKGIEQIVLGVDAGNTSAVKAYKRVGFRACQTPYINTKEESHLAMVWDLS